MGQRLDTTTRIKRLAEFVRPTALGEFNVVCYQIGDATAFGVVKGTLPADHLLVRVQSPCLFGESFGVNSCDCSAQLSAGLQTGATESAFLLVYLCDQEGRGHGMVQKIRAIAVEVNEHVDMDEAFHRLNLPFDLREWATAADIIKDLNGDRPIRLMTNNPKKVQGLQDQGITVSKRVPLLVDPPNEACRRYLRAKKRAMGHILPQVD